MSYIDDIVGVASSLEKAQEDFEKAIQLMAKLGLEEAEDKRTPPSSVVTWLGVEFDTVQGIMRMPKEKIQNSISLAQQWLSKKFCYVSQLRSIVGKLMHIASCSRTLRLFMNRMLEKLRGAKEGERIWLDQDFKADLEWVISYLPSFNGVQFMQEPPLYHNELVVDACLSGAGGSLGTKWYMAEFPKEVMDLAYNISELEMLNVLAALRLFKEDVKDSTLHIRSDNAATIVILQTGKGRCKAMLECARKIWFIAAQYNIQFRVSHIFGRDNVVADTLSRYHLSNTYKKKFAALREKFNPTMCKIQDSAFLL
ncbi:MAG: hypothetical protein GY702_00355 [Desulfobulbaceae bacterium]|nr:hypothetical protein [Desulfobulbaceae bacterium]